MKTAIFSAALLAAVVTSAHAQAVDPVQQSYDSAMAAFEARTAADAGTLQQKVIDPLAAIEGKAQSPVLNYKILIAESRAYYFMGTHTNDTEAKKSIHEAGYQKADAARKLDDRYAEGYYFYAINLGKWGLANGIMASLGKAGDMMDSANAAKERITLDNNAPGSGAAIDGYGPYRTTGYAYMVLPNNPFAKYKGSRSKSLADLKIAFEKAPNYPINASYYAESLGKKDDDKAQAIAVIDQTLKAWSTTPDLFVAKDPAWLRATENLEEIEDLKVLREKLSQ